MSNEITVLLVDDHGLVRKGFRRMLEDDPEIRVVGEGTNGREAIKLAHELHPRVIVMDMSMPGLDGVQATREILKHAPEIAVLILSMYSDENYVRNALDAGARGYLLKEALDVDLAGAIKDLAAPERRDRPRSAGPQPRARSGLRPPDAARKADSGIDRQGEFEQRNRGDSHSEREHGFRASRQSDVRAGHPPHHGIGGVGGPQGIGAVAVNRREFSVRARWRRRARTPIWASASPTSLRPPAFTFSTTAAPSERSICPKRWGPAAPFWTMTATAGRTSC
jgi:DNA-binding NarL/FixJ family response regulator